MGRGNVIWLSDTGPGDAMRCGQKAYQLGKLARAGFSVPDGFCVTSEAFKSAGLLPLWQTKRGGMVKAEAPHRERTLTHAMSLELAEDVKAAYRRLTERHPGPVAVRSSSTAEDLGGHSFAGIYDTTLNVAGEAELLEAIGRCWDSYWSSEAVCYRKQMGIPDHQHSMAVLVQAMVQPQYAGVIFTRSPAPDGAGTALVEVVEGVGESLVNGHRRGLRITVEIRSRRTVSPEKSQVPIADAAVNELVSTALAIERLQGVPQDIEWAIDSGGKLWVLQARPITVAAGAKTPARPSRDRRIRPYDEPFSPLGADIAVHRRRYWVKAINDLHKTRFRSDAKNLGGVLEYENEWRSAGPLMRLWMCFWDVLQLPKSGRVYAQYTDSVLPEYTRRLRELSSQDMTRLSKAELLRRFDEAVRLYLEFQYTSYRAVNLAVTATALLDKVCRLWRHSGASFDASALLGGVENLNTFRDRELARLGEALGRCVAPDELGRLDYDALVRLKDSERGRSLWTQVQSFNESYGYIWADRYPRDPAWELNKEAIVATLVHWASQDACDSLTQQHQRQQQRRAEVLHQVMPRSRLGCLLSPRWRLLRWTLDKAERFHPLKEERNHFVYAGVMVIRQYAHEAGRRLASERILEIPNDVFFLTWDESRTALSGAHIPVAALHQKVRKRRYEYQQARKSVASASRNGVPAASRAHARQLVGDPCSPGTATGPARIVRGLSELHRVGPGDIVICRRLRPAWSAVFGRAAGVVIEESGLLSHGAILAREYGVPAVINVPGALHLVPDGVSVTIDGDRGFVLLNE